MDLDAEYEFLLKKLENNLQAMDQVDRNRILYLLIGISEFLPTKISGAGTPPISPPKVTCPNCGHQF